MPTFIVFLDTEENSPGYADDPHLVAAWEPEELEARVGLPGRFWSDLEQAIDWAFVVQLHALIETLLTQILVENDPLLSETVVGEWYTHQKRKEVARLGLLDGRSISFIEVLSEIRNFFVHDVRRMYLDLSEHYATGLGPEQRRYLLRASLADPTHPRIREAEKHAKFSVRYILQLGVMNIAAKARPVRS
jgi:hypothetical protein